MNFYYAATGSAYPGGSASIRFQYYVRFAVGSIAYDCKNARIKGRIEPVVIKKYRILYNPYDVIYTDTLNAIWNEDELCNHEEAIDLATSYQERRQAMAESFMV